MRASVVCLLAAGVLVGAATAAAPDPEALVIRASDVPAGFRLDRSESGTRTNAQEAKVSAEAGRLFRRLGRVIGHQMIFERGEQSIEARSDVFRTERGSREMLRWAERQVRLSGIRGVRSRSVALGEEGLMVEVGSPPVEIYVYWRERQVWSAVGGRNLTKARVLALARLQQRRIVAELG